MLKVITLFVVVVADFVVVIVIVDKLVRIRMIVWSHAV